MNKLLSSWKNILKSLLITVCLLFLCIVISVTCLQSLGKLFFLTFCNDFPLQYVGVATLQNTVVGSEI